MLRAPILKDPFLVSVTPGTVAMGLKNAKMSMNARTLPPPAVLMQSVVTRKDPTIVSVMNTTTVTGSYVTLSRTTNASATIIVLTRVRLVLTKNSALTVFAPLAMKELTASV